MTREEFYTKYGDVKVKFNGYWKYTFVYKGEVNGEPISIQVGGTSDAIYRFDVVADRIETVAELQPYSGRCGDDGFYGF